MQDIATEKITTIKENVPQVYEAGKQKGHTEGYNAGYTEGETAGHEAGRAEGYNDGFTDGYRDGTNIGYSDGFNVGKDEGIVEGKQAEHSKMWDRLQLNGNLTRYTGQLGYFNGKLFGFNNFYPKYDIRPVGNASHLFYAWENNKTCGITDNAGSLKKRLEECGVVLDTSKVTDAVSMFNYCAITEIPTLDFTSLTDTTTYVFANSYSRIKTIEKIITKESVTYKNWFNNTDITNVTFEGVIGRDLDLSYSTRITPASMKSAILCLKNYAGTANEFLYTIRFAADRWAALEADSTAPDGGTWENYVISLGWLT